MRLSELTTGEKGVIVKVLGHGGFRKRIVEMGFIKGKTVEVLLNAPLKDPIKYKVLGYEISLRRQEAEMIEVVSEEEAKKEANQMIEVYNWFHNEILAIPSIMGRKTEKEKFSGAEYTLTNEALMYNGVALQSGTSHYFGQKFSEAYGIKFTNKENKEEYAYQTSWGTTTRMIGGLIMVHSDDYGLVLPPKIAPKQVAIIPIGNDEEVLNLCNEYKEKLNKEGIDAYVDLTEKSPGFKFAEAEVNGIPVRIELGKRDLENNKITFARRDTREKIEENINIDIVSYTKNLLETIQKDMYERAKKRRDELTFEAHNKEEIEKILNTQPGFIHAMWCGDIKCEEEIKQIKGCKSRCIVNEIAIDEKCVCCGKDAKYHVIWGIQY